MGVAPPIIANAWRCRNGAEASGWRTFGSSGYDSVFKAGDFGFKLRRHLFENRRCVIVLKLEDSKLATRLSYHSVTCRDGRPFNVWVEEF